MRAEFAKALTQLAHDDRRIVLLTGDLGYSVLEPFREAHPDRFFNVGVAEQNMLGIATGLAESGYVPFVYSIASFASMRAYEFVRNGAVVHHLPIRIVGVGAGFDYGANGATHYALEDIALMRVQPGLAVIAPADRNQAVAALVATTDVIGPVYFRLARAGDPVPGFDGRFELGRAQLLKDGGDAALVALGASATTALEAAAMLEGRGVSTSVVLVASVSPPPVSDLVELLAEVPLVATLEAHYAVGGLGSLVAETMAEHALRGRLVRCGPRELPRVSGSQQYLDELHGLSPAGVAEQVLAGLDVRTAT